MDVDCAGSVKLPPSMTGAAAGASDAEPMDEGTAGAAGAAATTNSGELTEADLLMLAARAAPDLSLPDKEREMLLKKLRDLASLERANGLSAMQSAQLHTFRLVHDGNSQMRVECLLCEKQWPGGVQSGRHFLKNFIYQHVGNDEEHARRAALGRELLQQVGAAVSETASRAEPSATAAAATARTSEPSAAAESMMGDMAANAPPRVSVSLSIASTHTTRSGVVFGAAVAPPTHALTEAELREFALADDTRLSPEQRDTIAALRLWTQQQLEGGAAAHRFRVMLVGETWRVECEACGSRSLAYAAGGINFLNHFQHDHLNRPRHKLAAAQRQEAICQALKDAAVSSAADAQAAARQNAAAASTPPSATQVELERGAAAAAQAVEAAHAALLRARDAAAKAAALATGELERHAPRGALEDQPLAATDLELLVGRTPALEWDEDESGTRCGVRCAWCRVRVSADVTQTFNVNEHLNGKRHRESATYGGRTIASFLGRCVRGPVPPPREPPKMGDLCMGYWKPTLAVSAGVADLRPLLEEEPTDGAAWRPDRWFRGSLLVSQGNGAEPTTTVVEGTLRAVGCKRYCVVGDGRRATDGMCDVCRRLPSDNNFHKMLTRRVAAAARTDRDESRINFRLLPRARLLELLREKGLEITRLRRQVWLLRQNYLRKAARVRSLLERLEEQRVRGDTKALVDDIIAIERAGKFKQRQTLFNFLRDLVHSLRCLEHPMPSCSSHPVVGPTLTHDHPMPSCSYQPVDVHAWQAA
jgi:hypothetical protein